MLRLSRGKDQRANKALCDTTRTHHVSYCEAGNCSDHWLSEQLSLATKWEITTVKKTSSTIPPTHPRYHFSSHTNLIHRPIIINHSRDNTNRATPHPKNAPQQSYAKSHNTNHIYYLYSKTLYFQVFSNNSFLSRPFLFLILIMKVLLWLCIILGIGGLGLYLHATQAISHTATVVVDSWSRLQSLLPTSLSPIQSLWWRYQISRNPEVAQSLHQWRYAFSWSYTAQQFLDHVAKGPGNNLISLTILEWRSIYDIDEHLTTRWLIQPWDYIQATTTNTSTKPRLPPTRVSLEWFLYPDTYFLDANQPIIPQLLRVQLQAYEDKVITPLSWQIDKALARMRRDWVTMSPYEFLILASIIEKEEKNHANQSRIGWLFVNRLKSNMKIDADISLCYNFKAPYSQCTTEKIVANLTDKTNPYNTRALTGLPPTPIANPSAETIRRLANRERHNYFYYLHDPHGQIYFWETLADHNLNKSKYLEK